MSVCGMVGGVLQRCCAGVVMQEGASEYGSGDPRRIHGGARYGMAGGTPLHIVVVSVHRRTYATALGCDGTALGGGVKLFGVVGCGKGGARIHGGVRSGMTVDAPGYGSGDASMRGGVKTRWGLVVGPGGGYCDTRPACPWCDGVCEDESKGESGGENDGWYARYHGLGPRWESVAGGRNYSTGCDGSDTHKHSDTTSVPL
ncbi:hypothetical protein K439DRAFT_1616685 [Ramaria rubella]|nr:hypothetical protein K439DRAFT_1616685 [Ramaria rubella]